MNNRVLKYGLVCAAVVYATVAWAQFLPTANKSNPALLQQKNRVLKQNVRNTNFLSPSENKVAGSDAKNENSYMQSVEKAQPVKKDTVKIFDKSGKRMNDDMILLYMKSFNVYRTASQQVRCAVRFALTSVYKEKVSNISYELKWPKMSTRLSFSNMEPQVEYYIDYLLLGEGCYTMDKKPNVIVNRCRVKNKTQEECAASVRWIKWSM